MHAVFSAICVAMLSTCLFAAPLASPSPSSPPALPPPPELLKKGEAGDVASQIELARFYSKSESYNEMLMYSWYLRAARQGNVGAQATVGFLLTQGVGTPENMTAAIHWLELAAAQGDLDSQLLLGTLYLRGEDGVPRLTRLAFDYFGKAAQQGSAQGQLMLAVCYENGIGCDQSTPDARVWAQKAAQQGDFRALTMLGDWVRDGVLHGTNSLKKTYSPDADAQARPYYLEAALRGGGRAHYELALAARREAEAQGVDDALFREQYFQALELGVEAGDVLALYELAMCYEWGYGVEVDVPYAAQLMADAAAMDYEPARYQLLRMMSLGVGVSASLLDEYSWLYL